MNYYCLLGSSVINAIQLGTYVFPSTNKNIGEPTISGSDGRWNTNTLYVYTSQEGNAIAQSSETTGDYTYNGVAYPVAEYWNDPAFSPGIYKKFCGWECMISLRNSNGDCTVSYHGTPANCTMALYSKVATAAFFR